jgi:hypothetical protein
MSTPYESGRLILELFSFRRDPALRGARDWFIGSFHPQSVDDIVKVLSGPDNPKYRMVVGYWDMAAALVHHGAIDRQMFIDANPEMFATFAKVEPLVAELRELTGNPEYLCHFEALVMEVPEVGERLRRLREELREAAEKSAGD